MSRQKTSQSAAIGAVTLLALSSGCGPSAGDESGAEAAASSYRVAAGEVRPGIEVLLEDSLHVVSGARIGLITNQTGIDVARTPTADRLHAHPEIELVALFGPEHGIRGTAEPGERVDDGIDDRTGVPVYSLYGSRREPPAEVLTTLDALVFDIQDIGARYFTYVPTMTIAMEAAAAANVRFIVLDRPNPIGGQVHGNVLEPEFASFVGRFPIPMRHGMTSGEVALLFAAEHALHDLDLRVIPATGWTRDAWFHDTGLPWVRPSPNMPDVESATHYPGTCLFEGTNLSVGRGTPRAFQQIGAPWLDARALIEAVTAYGLPGFEIEPVRFTPVDPGDGKYNGVELDGVRLRVTDPATYDPTRVAVALLVEARRLAGDRWEWRAAHFDRLAGTDRLRQGIESGDGLVELTSSWDEALAGFLERRAPHLIYP